jgi:hypothetical protein
VFQTKVEQATTAKKAADEEFISTRSSATPEEQLKDMRIYIEQKRLEELAKEEYHPPKVTPLHSEPSKLLKMEEAEVPLNAENGLRVQRLFETFISHYNKHLNVATLLRMGDVKYNPSGEGGPQLIPMTVAKIRADRTLNSYIERVVSELNILFHTNFEKISNQYTSALIDAKVSHISIALYSLQLFPKIDLNTYTIEAVEKLNMDAYNFADPFRSNLYDPYLDGIKKYEDAERHINELTKEVGAIAPPP